MDKEQKIVRIQTGFLDEFLEGGLPKGSTVLFSGYPGTGKTIACIQITYNYLKNGGQAIYITTEQRKEDIILQAKKLGMDLEAFIEEKRLIIIDPYTRVEVTVTTKEGEEKKVKKQEVEFNINSLKDALANAKKKLKNPYNHTLVVIDSLSAFWLDKPAVARRESYGLNNFLKKWGFTTLATLQIATSTDMAFGYGSVHIADGHIEMRFVKNGDLEYGYGLFIWKMRMTKHPHRLIPYEITDNGIKILKEEDDGEG